MGQVQFDTLIVGGGHAGAQSAIALRQLGYAGSIAIAGRETELPYERPPLSKEYLSGEKPWERMLIRPPAFWRERAISILGGTEIVAVDPMQRIVTTATGQRIGYANLIWAAGGDARRLTCAGADLAGVFTVRNRADADAMIAHMPAVQRAVVIGGGYIGLEAAAVLRKLGKDVTLIEALPRVLARVAGEALSTFIEQAHREQGVDLRTNSSVDHLTGSGGRVSGVALSGGEVLPADMVIVGIGIAPAVAPLIDAGARAMLNGVLVDDRCKTTLPSIWAIGDCAAQATHFAPAHGEARIESVQNANDQANTAARDIVGDPRPHAATPWFWSNQYDLKLQSVGLNSGHDQAILRGDPATRSFSIIYLRQGRVIALDCVNMVRDYAQGRKLVEAGTMAPVEQLADVTIALKDLIES